MSLLCLRRSGQRVASTVGAFFSMWDGLVWIPIQKKTLVDEHASADASTHLEKPFSSSWNIRWRNPPIGGQTWYSDHSVAGINLVELSC